MSFIFIRTIISQAERRGFESRLPLHFFNNLASPARAGSAEKRSKRSKSRYLVDVTGRECQRESPGSRLFRPSLDCKPLKLGSECQSGTLVDVRHRYDLRTDPATMQTMRYQPSKDLTGSAPPTLRSKSSRSGIKTYVLPTCRIVLPNGNIGRFRALWTPHVSRSGSFVAFRASSVYNIPVR